MAFIKRAHSGGKFDNGLCTRAYSVRKFDNGLCTRAHSVRKVAIAYFTFFHASQFSSYVDSNYNCAIITI